jgi:hypothetical protein
LRVVGLGLPPRWGQYFRYANARNPVSLYLPGISPTETFTAPECFLRGSIPKFFEVNPQKNTERRRALNKHRSNPISCLTLLLLALTLSLVLPRVALAQDADPPSRVARLNFIEGSISFQPAGTSDWLDANPNRPLTTGDQLWSDEYSRGELHMGGSVLRISAQTGVSFLNLSDEAVQIQVAQGSAILRVRRLGDDETYELDTPNVALTILRSGEYRVDVTPDGITTVVRVLYGNGEVTAGGQAYDVAPGQRYIFSGTEEVYYEAAPLPGPDEFEHWAEVREQREERFRSTQYVSPDMVGYEDLDDYGTWRVDPIYGHVWVPLGVAADWAPYRLGHWAFVAPWGWTWVEHEPWGFAPFHYGRWAYVGGVWAWVPGPMPVVGAVYVRPVYAPALVAFVGGGGFSAAIAVGGGAGVAWFPLGPRDVWVPSYHVSEAYMTRVNVTNSVIVNRTEITNVYTTVIVNKNTNVYANRTYMNQNAPGAVTAVPQATFQNGEPVAKAAVKINPEQVQHPRVVQAAGVAPTPKAVAGPNAPAKASAKPPAALASRPVVTKLPPSPRAIPVGHTSPPPATTYRPAVASKTATTPAAAPRPGQPGRPAETPAAARPEPAVTPTERPAERPYEAPSAKPAAPPAKPSVTPTERPAERPYEAPPAKPAQPTERQPEYKQPPAPAPKAAPPPEKQPTPEAKPAPAAHPAPEAKKPAPPPEQKQKEKEKEKDKEKEK